MQKMHAAKKDLLSKGVNPYSLDGQIHLKSFVDGEMAFLSNHPQPQGPGRPSGSKSLRTLERESLIQSIGIDPTSDYGRNIIRRLRDAEKKDSFKATRFVYRW